MVKTLSVTAFLLSSCLSFSNEDEQLNLERIDNHSSKLKLDGYYFRSSIGNGEELITIYFLYQNGIIITVGTVPVSKVDEIEKLVVTSTFGERLRRLKDSFGVYRVTDEEIQFEMWYPGPGPPKLVFLRTGEIVNDSTFRISRVSRKITGRIDTVNETYHFRKFHPKPDSTNEFID